MFFLLLLHEKEAPKASHKLNLGLYVLLFLKAVAVLSVLFFLLAETDRSGHRFSIPIFASSAWPLHGVCVCVSRWKD